MFNKLFGTAWKKLIYVVVIIALCIFVVEVCGCSSSTEPVEELDYVTIKYRAESEIVGHIEVYYNNFYGAGTIDPLLKVAGIERYPYWENKVGGCLIAEGKDFKWDSNKYHCKTIEMNYIEIAMY